MLTGVVSHGRNGGGVEKSSCEQFHTRAQLQRRCRPLVSKIDQEVCAGSLLVESGYFMDEQDLFILSILFR